MKIAVLGVGSAGLRHLHALRSVDGVDAVAISRRRSRLAELEAEGRDGVALAEALMKWHPEYLSRSAGCVRTR